MPQLLKLEPITFEQKTIKPLPKNITFKIFSCALLTGNISATTALKTAERIWDTPDSKKLNRIMKKAAKESIEGLFRIFEVDGKPIKDPKAREIAYMLTIHMFWKSNPENKKKVEDLFKEIGG